MNRTVNEQSWTLEQKIAYNERLIAIGDRHRDVVIRLLQKPPILQRVLRAHGEAVEAGTINLLSCPWNKET